MNRTRLSGHRDRAAALIKGLDFDDREAVARLRRTLRTLSDEQALSLSVVLVDRVAGHRDWRWGGRGVLRELGRRRLPWTAEDVTLLFDLAARADGVSVLIALAAATAAAGQLDAGDLAHCADRFERAHDLIDGVAFEQSERARLRLRLRLLAESPAQGRRTGVRTGVFQMTDGWSRAAVERLLTVDTDVEVVSDLLAHAAAIPAGPRPTATWLKLTADLLADRPGVVALVRDLLELTHTCEPADVETWGWPFRRRIDTSNEDLARGLLWTALVSGEAWLVPLVPHLHALRPEIKLTNTCFAVLGRRGDAAAIAALTRLQRGTRDRGELTQIGAALDEAATRAGIPRSELVEMTISDGDLDGRRQRRFLDGDVAAVLALDGRAKVAVAWSHGGTCTAKPPAHAAPELIATVKRAAKELRTLVAGERDRLEDLLVEERDWPLDTWRQRYLDQPVTGSLAGRLLWRVVEDGRDVTGLPAPGGRFTTVDGRLVEPGPRARIRVWHPATADPDEVRAWRRYLLDHELAQPFKQAFREVYLLTPAEEQTGLYSNRFAAHVLGYQQAYALMKQRRWSGNYLGDWDGGYDGEAKREFPAHGLRAVFRHDRIDDGNHDEVRYCATDQVRFERGRGRAWAAVPLAEIPPRVFSEAMRDVDLFVGVCSIAADPTWADRGTDRHFGYWERAAFGELTENGRVRRQVIAHLLPKLKIRDRARLEGNYLAVQGSLHGYRIHIGSGNILMSPNDRYLCVVPTRRTTPAGVRFVPFEGDEILAVVLSKAFMLADDHRITDPSILRQLA